MKKTTKLIGRNTLLAALLALGTGPVLAAGETDNVQQSPQTMQESSGASGTSGTGAAGDSATTGTGTSGSGTSAQQDMGQSSGGTSGAGQSQASKSAGGAAGTTAQPPVLMLFPLDVVTTTPSMQQGCWARIYDRENYTGDSLTLVGPTSIADMTGPFGLNWDDRVNSIEVGPKTTVRVFDNESFRDQVAQFKPEQKVPDLSKRMGFFDEFASIRLDCAQG